MPKTKLCKGSDVSAANPAKTDEIMADFQLPDELRKQLEYPANVKKRQLALEHIEKKLIERLLEINTRLKEDKAKVSIQRQGDSLLLQATLPLKPDEISKDKKFNKQTKISLGIPFNADGLKTAEEEARELGRLIARKIFVWNEKYLRTRPLKQEVVKTISELIEEFEDRYFLTRKKNRQSLHTFSHHKRNILMYVPLEKSLSNETIISAIQKTKASSAARQGLISALSVFCNTFDYQFNFKGYKNGYTPKKRTLPTDKQIEKEVFKIIAIRSTFQGEEWQWVYGMIATYGLRPHEIFAINVENFIDLSNTLHALTLDESITDGLKTGGRTIFPLPIEWVDRFNLKNVTIPKLVKAHLDAKFENRSRTISRVFLRRNMSFQPYDLRHTYAVRGHVMGIPLKEMADNIGHSINMHTKTYQKYMTLDHRRIVYQKAIDRFQNIKNEQTELEQVKAENTLLKIEVENLKSENESIRALLTQRQISNLLSK